MKKIIKEFIYALLIAIIIVFTSCQSTGNTHNTNTGFADAQLVAEQRLELERQRQLIAELERIIRSGSSALAEAERYLGELDTTNLDWEDWLRRVDEFVRRVIAVQRELGRIQSTDSGENARER